jgi:hypothetical protein
LLESCWTSKSTLDGIQFWHSELCFFEKPQNFQRSPVNRGLIWIPSPWLNLCNRLRHKLVRRPYTTCHLPTTSFGLKIPSPSY